MTFAPANLTAVRRLLLDHLDIRENSNAYPTDLDPNEVGIVGDPAHRGGYHCGRDRVDSDDYSVDESARDRRGLSNAASAIDIGWFEVRVRGKVHNLRTFSMWLVAQCKANTPDSRHIREIIYSPDGKVVRRYDRLGVRSSGDSSHLWHTHESDFRDTERIDKRPLFRRYLTTIGLIESEDDMSAKAESQIANLYGGWYYGGPSMGRKIDPADDTSNSMVRKTDYVLNQLDALARKVDAIAATPPGTVQISDEQLERVLRKVVGSVDGATPQG